MRIDPGQRRWRVRLSDDSGRIFGSGTMLDERHLLTCAHVVQDMGGPDVGVVVDFVCVGGVAPRVASVVDGGWVPPTEDERGDIALLRLDRSVPDIAGAPLHRMLLHEEQSVRAYGFPAGSDDGMWTRARLVGEGGPAGEWIQLECAPQAKPIAAGYSGAAVLDDRTGHVVGIVVGRYTGDVDRVGWMIPVETMLGHLPLLEQWARGRPAVDESLTAVRSDAVDLPLARKLSGWFTGEGAGALWVVVTGERGSAADAALRLVVALADRERSARLPDPPNNVGDRPPAGSVVLAVDASGRTAEEVRQRIDERLGRGPGGPFGGIVVVDAVDDAAEPHRLVAEVLLPLARRAEKTGFRVVLGFRRESSPELVVVRSAASGAVVPGVPDRLAALSASVAELAAIEEHQVVVAPRFAGVPELKARAKHLGSAVNLLRSAWASGDTAWVERHVGDSEREVARALDGGRRQRALLDGLVERHDLLRHRLDAFDQKARDHGLVEDPELDDGYGRVWALLHEVPCDLRAAESAVDDYLDGLHRRIDEQDEQDEAGDEQDEPDEQGGTGADGGRGGDDDGMRA